ncbi:hypothetical protein T484DRAFT_1764380 [Baffinella frigidus]|nr:hypothetical protein T484DRAFT_1764380 [Cryptophyta sp. CCMP2293]
MWERKKALCRYDFFQQGQTVCLSVYAKKGQTVSLSVYAKKVDPEECKVRLSATTLSLSLTF